MKDTCIVGLVLSDRPRQIHCECATKKKLNVATRAVRIFHLKKRGRRCIYFGPTLNNLSTCCFPLKLYHHYGCLRLYLIIVEFVNLFVKFYANV